jgi:hypothetical protein
MSGDAAAVSFGGKNLEHHADGGTPAPLPVLKQKRLAPGRYEARLTIRRSRASVPPRIPGRGPRVRETTPGRIAAISVGRHPAALLVSLPAVPGRAGRPAAPDRASPFRSNRLPAAARAEWRSFASRARAADGNRTPPRGGARLLGAQCLERGRTGAVGWLTTRRHAKAPVPTPANTRRIVQRLVRRTRRRRILRRPRPPMRPQTGRSSRPVTPNPRHQHPCPTRGPKR